MERELFLGLHILLFFFTLLLVYSNAQLNIYSLMRHTLLAGGDPYRQLPMAALKAGKRQHAGKGATRFPLNGSSRAGP